MVIDLSIFPIRQNFTSYILALDRCTTDPAYRCPNECEKTIYQLTSRFDVLTKEQCRRHSELILLNDDYFGQSGPTNRSVYELGQRCYTKVVIKISPLPFVTITHKPFFTFEEFIGIVGGHLGIWLGLSVYKVVQLTVHLFYYGTCRLVVWLRRRR